MLGAPTAAEVLSLGDGDGESVGDDDDGESVGDGDTVSTIAARGSIAGCNPVEAAPAVGVALSLGAGFADDGAAVVPLASTTAVIVVAYGSLNWSATGVPTEQLGSSGTVTTHAG